MRMTGLAHVMGKPKQWQIATAHCANSGKAPLRIGSLSVAFFESVCKQNTYSVFSSGTRIALTVGNTVGNRQGVSPGPESLHQLGIKAVSNEVKRRSRGSDKNEKRLSNFAFCNQPCDRKLHANGSQGTNSVFRHAARQY
jgi:hypothetical protein